MDHYTNRRITTLSTVCLWGVLLRVTEKKTEEKRKEGLPAAINQLISLLKEEMIL